MPITSSHSLTIHSGQGNYQVDFSEEASALPALFGPAKNYFVIIDQEVARLYRDTFADWFREAHVYEAPASEDEKTMAGVTRFLEFLQENGANKKSRVLAIGGGIIQDIATFAAHHYYRGISWEYIPTTLLGMSDSCIGAKCGINLRSFKNQLGVFHSPSRVVICTGFLKTLSDNDVRSGYGEIVKLLLTRAPEDFDLLTGAFARGGFRNPELLQLIRASLDVKKEVIEKDEYESDLRRILNYGHTFGHALEAITNHGVPHGFAVAWGVDIANFVSMKRGRLAASAFERIHSFIAANFNWKITAPHDAAALRSAMGRDKKAAQGTVALILLQEPGKLKIVPTPLDDQLEAEMAEYLRDWNVFSRA